MHIEQSRLRTVRKPSSGFTDKGVWRCLVLELFSEMMNTFEYQQKPRSCLWFSKSSAACSTISWSFLPKNPGDIMFFPHGDIMWVFGGWDLPFPIWSWPHVMTVFLTVLPKVSSLQLCGDLFSGRSSTSWILEAVCRNGMVMGVIFEWLILGVTWMLWTFSVANVDLVEIGYWWLLICDVLPQDWLKMDTFNEVQKRVSDEVLWWSRFLSESCPTFLLWSELAQGWSKGTEEDGP